MIIRRVVTLERKHFLHAAPVQVNEVIIGVTPASIVTCKDFASMLVDNDRIDRAIGCGRAIVVPTIPRPPLWTLPQDSVMQSWSFMLATDPHLPGRPKPVVPCEVTRVGGVRAAHPLGELARNPRRAT